VSSVTQSDDRRALDDARAGSLEAFERLVGQHAPRLIRFCYHLTGSWDEAREAAQESFARAWSCLHQYDASRPFAPWLLTIASRLVAARQLSRRRREQAESQEAHPRTAPISIERSLALKEALARLTPHQRQAVVLCDLHGFSATEAARMIGCTGSTVRVLRFLARQRLRRELDAAATLTRIPEVSPERTP